MRLFLLLSFAFLCGSAFGSNQADSITFKVVDDATAEGVEYCILKIKSSGKGCMSDENGMFLIAIPDSLANDTITFSSISHHARSIPISNFSPSDTNVIELSRKEQQLSEIVVTPKKTKEHTVGKKRRSGMTKFAFFVNTPNADSINTVRSEAGSHVGYIVKSKKDKRKWLKSFGFYIEPVESMLSSMKFRITVYDSKDVEGWVSTAFEPIVESIRYVDYSKEQVIDGKFTTTFDSPILLPEKAMIGIELLQNPGEEFITFKTNSIIGGTIWIKSIEYDQWVKIPIAAPFFLKIIEEK